jgi:hypothetical protein
MACYLGVALRLEIISEARCADRRSYLRDEGPADVLQLSRKRQLGGGHGDAQMKDATPIPIDGARQIGPLPPPLGRRALNSRITTRKHNQLLTFYADRHRCFNNREIIWIILMYGYDRTYKAGRAVCSWIEFVGWLIVVLGVMLALAGFLSGGLMGILSGGLGQGDAIFILRIVFMVPGVLMAAGGLMSVMLAQHAKATMDTAEMTSELLLIARAGLPPAERGESILTQANEKSGFEEGFFENYKSVNIMKTKVGYLAYGEDFKTIEEAKRFVDDSGF